MSITPDRPCAGDARSALASFVGNLGSTESHPTALPLKAADWLALREKLRASANADTPYLRILRKYLRE